MPLAYLGIGSNQGNTSENLANAVRFLSLEAGKVVRQSSFYSSKPWGFESVNDFLNGALLVETDLSPENLLAAIKNIERRMGRQPRTSPSYSDRIIDIDILLYDNLVMDQPLLKIPHPLMHLRYFVLFPLAEIAPEAVHPVLNTSIAGMLSDFERRGVD